MAPYNKSLDMSLPQIFSAVVNGLQVDSYRLIIKSLENLILHDSGSSISVPNTDSAIIYNGTWTKSTNINVDDSNSSIQYYGTGWKAIAGSAFWNSTAHYSFTADDYFQYVFVGTGINCYFANGKGGGIFNVSIDGVDYGTVDTYINAADKQRVKSFSIETLAFAKHTIKFVVTGDKQALATGANVEFDYFQILNTNGSKNSSTKGNYLQYTFTSNGIQLYADMTPDSGTVDIYIDGVLAKNIDLYSSTYNMNSMVYSNYDLTHTQHIIKVVNTGNKNTQSTNCFVYFESLEVTNKTILTTMLHDKQTFSVVLPGGTITQRGALKWQLTYWNSSNDGENVSSGEMIFTNMSTPTSVMNAIDTVTSKSYTFTNVYTQAENIPIKKYNYKLYSVISGIKKLIDETGDVYSSYLQYSFDGFNNGNNYLISLEIETQNPQGGQGMTVTTEKAFNVVYPILTVLSKPTITQLLDKSAAKIDWASINLNPGIITGQFSYIDDFINLSNSALSLELGATLNYSTTIVPVGSTCPFMIKIPKTYNGIIRTTNDGKCKIGYNLSLQKFYTVINNITTYSNTIKITDNPFFISLIGNRVVIRQYNIYNQVKNIYDMKVSDLYNYPIAFMVQENN